MPIPEIIKSFQNSREAIIELEKLQIPNRENFINRFVEDNFSYWDLALPILNLHVIPAIKSNNYKYSLFFLLSNIVKIKFFRGLKSNRKSSFNTREFSGSIDVLFLGFSSYINRDVYEPFINRTKGAFDNCVILCDSDGIEDNIKVNHINVLSYFKSKNKNTKKTLSILTYFFESTKLKHLNFYQIFKINLWIRYIFIPRYYKYVLSSKFILNQYTPNYIIESDIADPRSRAVVILAKSLKLKTITLQFAFYNRDSFEWYYQKSDNIIIWGKWFENLFVNFFQINKNYLSILGSPRFDNYLIEPTNNDISEEKSVLIISSYEIAAYNKITRTISFTKYLINVIELLLNEEYKIYIKVHPLEVDCSYLDKYFSKGLEIVSIDQFDDTIRKVRFVISHGSSLTFNALALKKTVIYPTNPNIVWWDDIFASSNLGIGFYTYEELLRILNLHTEINLTPLNLFSEFVNIDPLQTSSVKILNKLLND